MRGDRRALIAAKWREERRATSTRNRDARAFASSLLAELRAEAAIPPRPPPPPPPPPPSRPLTSKAGKKRLADARLLMMLAKGGQSPPPKAVKYRCGMCAACARRECGECGNCRDKKRFGGRGCRKQACAKRPVCLYAHEMLDDEPDNP